MTLGKLAFCSSMDWLFALCLPNYLQGKGVPKVISLIILRNLFNVSIDDLFSKDLSKQKIREATRSGAETEMLEHLSSVQNALENANQNINGIKKTLVYLIENRKEIK